jgi:hypothetical protein
MKRSREFFLWAFFLALCFWAGYLKGFLPLTFKQNLFVKGPVRIYNAAPFDFPRPFIAELEEALGQKVDVYKIRSWDELQAKMVTKTGAHLLFAPSHWATDLSREGVIVGLSYIQPKIEKYVSPDFISLQGKSALVLPLYWILTKFVTADVSFANQTLDQIVKDKALGEVHLFPDQDLAAIHVKRWKLALKDIEGVTLKNAPSAMDKNSLWEVSSFTQVPKSKVIESTGQQALLTYGMMIPKNSANRRVSYRALEKLMEPALQEKILGVLPLGTTLLDSPDLQLDKNQRASQIRNLRLHELILLDKRNLQDVQDAKLKYNFIF